MPSAASSLRLRPLLRLVLSLLSTSPVVHAAVPALPALAAAEDVSFYAVRDVPRGRVETVHYPVASGGEKRLHVYLPPDYDTAPTRRYPVLYLNHGGGENDAHWTSENVRSGGFAHRILDNLIADGLARPMIIAMPHTGGLVSGTPSQPGQDDACTREYLHDLLPFVDAHYRTVPDRTHRAVAGLSMGGFVPLNTGLHHLDTFGELYVYSSGYWPDLLPLFKERSAALLASPDLNQRLATPIYFAVGETDIAYRNSLRTLAVFADKGVRHYSVISSHGHEWLNWRRYLHQSARIMFQNTP